MSLSQQQDTTKQSRSDDQKAMPQTAELTRTYERPILRRLGQLQPTSIG